MSDSTASTAPYIEYSSKSFFAILVSLFLAGFAIFSSLYCVQPMMPILTQFFAISPTQSSLTLSVSTIALAIGLLFTGLISDRFGRKPIMVYSLFCAASLLILSACFPKWHIFLLTRILLGLTVSGVAAVAMTYIGEEIAQKDIGFAMGLYISGTAIGGMGGRLIAGVLVDFISWQSATLFIGILNLLAAFIFYLLLPASKHFKAYPICFTRFKTALMHNLRDPKLCLLFVQGFILMGCFVSIFNYISYHLLEHPFHVSQSMIGLISIAYLCGIYSSPRAAAWGKRFGRNHVLIAMLLLMLLGLMTMLISHIGFILLGLMIFTFAFFAAHSTVSSWVAIQSLQYKAMGSSLYLFFYYCGSSILGSSSGAIWESLGWFGLILSIATILCLGVAIACYLQKRE
ncbi:MULTISPECIES: MFS transporter [unclassified Acinetobacter]|uniref:MFS transporter n=1 Tax=unclassified Acinetobacter TaxID=196816 RepID=UPI002934479D|nr:MULTISPECIES: MFS transporter [unclassified Acinetobacter]WOE30708.1 MFS transporter [Acinetobacter sp. SAAs470]WOE38901.1 MFS transporter [Acinetobacter sp. SAAs474]